MPVSEARTKRSYQDALIAGLVQENDELKAENRRLREEIDQPTFTSVEVGAELELSGFRDPDDNTVGMLDYWALTFPGWWSKSMLTDEGRRYVRLTRNGISFTREGVRKAKDLFLPDGGVI